MTGGWRRGVAALGVVGGTVLAVVLLTGPEPGPVQLCADRQNVDLDDLRAEPEIWPLNKPNADIEVMLQPARTGAYYKCVMKKTGDHYSIVSTLSD